MEIVGGVLFIVGLIAGYAATIFGLPGTFVIAADVLLAGLFTGFNAAPLWVVVVLLAIATGAELADNVVSAWAVRRFEGSGRGQAGALVLGIAGAIVGGGLASLLGALGLTLGPVAAVAVFVIGPIVGGAAGGFLGAFLAELMSGRPAGEAARAGLGAFLGRALGVLVKIVLATVMVAVAAYMVLPHLFGRH
jgi:hypothetical protein